MFLLIYRITLEIVIDILHGFRKLIQNWVEKFNVSSCIEDIAINIFVHVFLTIGTKPEHFAKIAYKNHKHSRDNP